MNRYTFKSKKQSIKITRLEQIILMQSSAEQCRAEQRLVKVETVLNLKFLCLFLIRFCFFDVKLFFVNYLNCFHRVKDDPRFEYPRLCKKAPYAKFLIANTSLH